MTVSVEVRRLGLTYGDTPALRDLTFTLAGGGTYGLFGQAGAGKTSLLSVISAFRRASTGMITVGGANLFENRNVTRHICFVREDLDACALGKVRHALEFAAALRPGWDAGYAHALLRRFGVPPEAPVHRLRRPDRAALAVVLGLAARAPLTIFDETHLPMAVDARYDFYEDLAEAQRLRPRTIILAADRVDEIGTLCDEVVILHRGRLVEHARTQTLRARGASVSGPTPVVDRFIAGQLVLSERPGGDRKSATVYGVLSERLRDEAERAGLDLGPIALSEVYAYLTGGSTDAGDARPGPATPTSEAGPR